MPAQMGDTLTQSHHMRVVYRQTGLYSRMIVKTDSNLVNILLWDDCPPHQSQATQ